jgi:CHAD domain-containing protein
MSEAARVIGGEPPVVMARMPPLTRDMSVQEAFGVTLDECRDHIEGNVAAVTESRHSEGLHQLRVGLRRLNVALSNFAPGFEDLRGRAKALFAATGTARDLDVFLEDLFEPVVAELEPREGFAILRLRAETARARAWDAAVTQVLSVEFSALLDELAVAPARWPQDVPPSLIATHAPAVLDVQLARAKKRGRGLKDMPHDDAHRLRIALKKLRYTSDFFAGLYKERPVQRYIGEMKKLQDLLGTLNDAAQVRIVLGRLMMEEATSAPVQADLSYAAGLINGWHQARAARLKRKAHKFWRTLKNAEPFWA